MTVTEDTDHAELTELVDTVPALAEDTVEFGSFPERDEWQGLCQMAMILSHTDLVSGALRRKPNDVLLVLMTARDLGIAPTSALSSLYVIDGRVTIPPKIRLALLHQAGKGRVVPRQRSAERCVADVYDARGELVETAELTIDEIPPELRRKDNWKSWPQRMLWWRLAGFLLDDHWPEIGMGIYSPDELGAVTDEDGIPIGPTSVTMPVGYDDQRLPQQRPEWMDDRDALAAEIADITKTNPTLVDCLRDAWPDGLPKVRDMASAEDVTRGWDAVTAAMAAFDELGEPFLDADDLETADEGTGPERLVDMADEINAAAHQKDDHAEEA